LNWVRADTLFPAESVEIRRRRSDHLRCHSPVRQPGRSALEEDEGVGDRDDVENLHRFRCSSIIVEYFDASLVRTANRSLACPTTARRMSNSAVWAPAKSISGSKYS